MTRARRAEVVHPIPARHRRTNERGIPVHVVAMCCRDALSRKADTTPEHPRFEEEHHYHCLHTLFHTLSFDKLRGASQVPTARVFMFEANEEHVTSRPFAFLLSVAAIERVTRSRRLVLS